ncbi:MAG TPA: hypothetical protein PKO12_12085, partial [Holophaga sp.]|nr:hypothetical protein [Holophaga sp.]
MSRGELQTLRLAPQVWERLARLRQPGGAEAAGFAVDGERGLGRGAMRVQGQQGGEHVAGEHVAAVRALVAQDAVEQQVDGGAWAGLWRRRGAGRGLTG